MIHTLKPGEAYIEMLAVSPETRGQGVGTKLLQWAEKVAIERGATVLTLAVVAGNPAKGLYERFGFVDQREGCVDSCLGAACTCCLLGCPHRRLGAHNMAKPLDSPTATGHS
eukprot:SRR837773.5104.p1 GENE.SRR837773.5104~~SRR837773.5104.p1  ORF type:complete len:130 (+),score=33.79 SRR837773.5104:57-392(+)